MNRHQILELLSRVANGEVGPAEAAERFRDWPMVDLEFAQLDTQRALRCGFPEVIFGAKKTSAQLAAIFGRLAASDQNVLATRVGPKGAARILRLFPEAQYDRLSRTLTLRRRPAAPAPGQIAIVAAGTADLAVAEEARITAEILDQPTRSFYDCGVAGLHRLLNQIDEIRKSSVVVVVAGMDGALPSVVGGLVDVPVIAVPTSVGYGASLGGIAALLTMLNSCAAGVSVVNIDNGFGAGYQASLINRATVSARPDL